MYEMKFNNTIERTEKFDISSLNCILNPAFAPRQIDNASCGIFMMYTADYLELGKKPDFSRDHASILRKRTALFLNRGQLPDSNTHWQTKEKQWHFGMEKDVIISSAISLHQAETRYHVIVPSFNSDRPQKLDLLVWEQCGRTHCLESICWTKLRSHPQYLAQIFC